MGVGQELHDMPEPSPERGPAPPSSGRGPIKIRFRRGNLLKAGFGTEKHIKSRFWRLLGTLLLIGSSVSEPAFDRFSPENLLLIGPGPEPELEQSACLCFLAQALDLSKVGFGGRKPIKSRFRDGKPIKSKVPSRRQNLLLICFWPETCF